MRTLLIALAVIVLAGCHGSSNPTTAPANTSVNPGPNPTTGDPGPNNTANGPQTLQGTIVSKSGCVGLVGRSADQSITHYQLDFTVERVQHKGTSIVLSGSDGDHTVGPHDVLYLAGQPESGSGPCGSKFRVDKVVAVAPG